MNRLELRSKAREVTELTADDVADATIDMYARDGYDRIINMERRWPTFQTSATLTLTAGDATYNIATQVADLREVISLVHADTVFQLDLISLEQGERLWRNTTSGRPLHWAEWAGEIQVFPAPDSEYTLNVRGYRKPIAWYDSDTLEIDADERLHIALLYYVVARLYQLQEDVDMSNFYASTFAEAVRSAHADIMRPSSHRPLVLNQGITYGPSSWTRFL
jgi:hypothetical protein